jgi:hypothetical protein
MCYESDQTFVLRVRNDPCRPPRMALLHDQLKPDRLTRSNRFRNPDEELPQDFDVRRDEYYTVLEQRVNRACLWRTCVARWRPRSPPWMLVCPPM